MNIWDLLRDVMPDGYFLVGALFNNDRYHDVYQRREETYPVGYIIYNAENLTISFMSGTSTDPAAEFDILTSNPLEWSRGFEALSFIEGKFEGE